MREYRIVSDGIRWRIQVLCITFWRAHWKWCGRTHPDCGFVVSDFESLEKAEETVIAIQKEDAARDRGYKVVKSFDQAQKESSP